MTSRLDRIALRHTRRAFDAQLRDLDARPSTPVLLLAFSWVLYGLILALFATGVWLSSLSFPGVGLFFGLVVIGVAVELRPRFGRPPKFATEVPASEAPALHELVGRVAAAVGTPAPAIYVVDDEFNASAGAYGLRRRRALVLGLPIWNALPARHRVALLGHELGHFVNRDPRRGLVVQPALTAFARVVRLFEHEERGPDSFGLLVIHWALNAVKAVVRLVLRVPQVLLAVAALRDGQRAEYHADAVAARVAGRDAVVGLLDLSTLLDSVQMLVKRDARNGRPVTGWPATVEGLLAEAGPGIEARREATLERVTLFDTHPPSGLRARVAAARPSEGAAVVLDEAWNARIDTELARHSTRAARTLRQL
ncbi:M48 family metallopeptidase [Dactylosporangium sp. AC04546]|uniref:M48 family metalloprotease n=1 Tax=Dactylosporangium sp. AC04546 TaxID=2862460 RepID=UPI001EE085CC|nr:M48 family metallopeptidase [Dactylosporangium sp. AC04546]WVK83039.1 M48 family metallopeptidase [Dactylosporangium sp. AC04546]